MLAPPPGTHTYACTLKTHNRTSHRDRPLNPHDAATAPHPSQSCDDPAYKAWRLATGTLPSHNSIPVAILTNIQRRDHAQHGSVDRQHFCCWQARCPWWCGVSRFPCGPTASFSKSIGNASPNLLPFLYCSVYSFPFAFEVAWFDFCMVQLSAASIGIVFPAVKKGSTRSA